jgi:hypothetical protein
MFQKPKLPSDFKSSEDEEVCAGHALGFPLRSELGFLPIENVTLDVFRCVCEVYSTGYAHPGSLPCARPRATSAPTKARFSSHA